MWQRRNKSVVFYGPEDLDLLAWVESQPRAFSAWVKDLLARERAAAEAPPHPDPLPPELVALVERLVATRLSALTHEKSATETVAEVTPDLLEGLF